ncbi:hypothetical protein ACKWTF_000798 [Chironomus riparius]
MIHWYLANFCSAQVIRREKNKRKCEKRKFPCDEEIKYLLPDVLKCGYKCRKKKVFAFFVSDNNSIQLTQIKIIVHATPKRQTMFRIVATCESVSRTLANKKIHQHTLQSSNLYYGTCLLKVFSALHRRWNFFLII